MFIFTRIIQIYFIKHIQTEYEWDAFEKSKNDFSENEIANIKHCLNLMHVNIHCYEITLIVFSL